MRPKDRNPVCSAADAFRCVSSPCKTWYTDRIIAAKGDAETFNASAAFGTKGFERVFFSYSLSMIPNWQGILANAVSQLSDEGSLHVVDFGQTERWPAFTRNAMRWWLGRFHVTPRSSFLNLKTVRMAGGYAWLVVLSRTRVTNRNSSDLD